MPALAIGDLPLRRGGVLKGANLSYETWGEPAEEAALVCHALTGNAHVASANGEPGWWDGIVGEGRTLDPRNLYILSVNVPGGCYGSTGPDPEGFGPDGKPFPAITVEDMVEAQARLLEKLGVRRLSLVVGGSLGGMQTLAWAGNEHLPVTQVVAIAAADRLPALQIALCHAQHMAIEFGIRHGDPQGGMYAARAIAMATYRSDRHFDERFGRDKGAWPGRDFSIETYLDHHAEKLAERFSAYTYLLLSRAMAGFEWDMKVREGTRVDLISISGDWLFPPEYIADLHRRLRRAGVRGDHLELHSDLGHDGFLADQEGTGRLLAQCIRRHDGLHPRVRAL